MRYIKINYKIKKNKKNKPKNNANVTIIFMFDQYTFFFLFFYSKQACVSIFSFILYNFLEYNVLSKYRQSLHFHPCYENNLNLNYRRAYFENKYQVLKDNKPRSQ